MKAIKITENVYWVGAIDNKLRLFHGYSTEKGSTYNAYLIIDDEITLIDSVKAPFSREMFERISSVVDPSKITKIICNHIEQDHSGAIPHILEIAKNAKVYASSMAGVNGLKNFYGIESLPIKSGESLCLGKSNLQFLQTPMVHWPDNMVCFLKEHGILFSNDAFGQHFATNQIFDYQNNLAEILYQAKKYFANIVLPYCNQVNTALNDCAKLNIKTIATSHGIIWQKHIQEIISLYKEITSTKINKKALIVYDTMWGSTEKIAKAIENNFLNKGYSVLSMDLQNNHISNIMTEIIDCEYIAVGSPTLNNNILPTVSAFLCYLQGLSPKNKKFIAFGSYGWGGQSTQIIQDTLIKCKFTPACEPAKCVQIPTCDFLNSVEQLNFN